MIITITGGSGNLAEYVVKELEKEHDLLLFDRVRPGEGRYAYRTDHTFIDGDITSFEDCQKAVEQADAVIHLGAITRGAARNFSFDETMRVNTMGTWYVLEAARQANVRTVVAASTDVVLGFDFLAENPSYIDYLPIDEEHPLYPDCSYGYSKMFNEQMMAAFSRIYGMRTYALRPSPVLRPEMMRKLIEKPGTEWAGRGFFQPATEWSVGFWGYEDIRDMARAFRMCLEAAEDMPLHGVFFTNAADTRVPEDSIQLVRRFRPELLEKVISLEGRQSFISTAKARKFFGWEAQHSWTDLLDQV